jgi:membrane-associated protein
MGVLTSLQSSLQVDALLSYLIAIILPALDAIFPLLPSETAIIALGVATAGSTDPRIALLVACAAAGAFLGDNLSYLIGRRFGPAAERRFFSTPKGKAARAWAERSLERFGVQLIVVCRFIPAGRTAVTLTCGLTGYPRGRFVAGTAAAGVIWALYAFFIGRLGGKAFEDSPWAGFLIATGGTIVISALVEAVRRLRARRSRVDGSRVEGSRVDGSRVDAGQVETHHAGEHKADGDQLHDGDGVAQQDHPQGGRPGGADPRPDRVGGPDLELAQRDCQQTEADQR